MDESERTIKVTPEEQNEELVEIETENAEEDVEIEQEPLQIQSGVKTYAELPDKPAINDVTLEGNKSFEDLGHYALTNMEIEQLLNN